MDISVILDNGRPWAEVRELGQAADGLGAYAIYLCDHFMGHTDDDTVTDEGMLESMTLLARWHRSPHGAGSVRWSWAGPTAIRPSWRTSSPRSTT